MRETEPSLMVNWYEVKIFDPAKNKVIYKNTSIANHELNEQNLKFLSNFPSGNESPC